LIHKSLFSANRHISQKWSSDQAQSFDSCPLPFVSLEDVCWPGPVWTSPTWAGSGVRLLEILDHSRRRGEPGDKMPLSGDNDVISMGLKNWEEEEELSVDVEFWFSPSSSLTSTPSQFSPSPRAERSLGSSLSSPQIRSFSISGSTSDASNNSMLEDKWLCDFPNSGQAFPNQHHRKQLSLLSIISPL
jgi:hypothetical protein